MSFGPLRHSIIQTKQQHKNDRPREILRSVLLYQYGADFEQISFCKQRKNESNDITLFNPMFADKLLKLPFRTVKKKFIQSLLRC